MAEQTQLLSHWPILTFSVYPSFGRTSRRYRGSTVDSRARARGRYGNESGAARYWMYCIRSVLWPRVCWWLCRNGWM